MIYVAWIKGKGTVAHSIVQLSISKPCWWKNNKHMKLVWIHLCSFKVSHPVMWFGWCLGSLLFHFAVKHPKRIAINATTPKASKDVKMEPAALDMGNDWYENQLMGLVWWVWWCCCKFESIHFSCPGASFTSASTFAVTLDAAIASSCLESLKSWWLTTGSKSEGSIYS